MFYKSLNVPGNSRNTVNTFLGYNHNHQISSGEFYDMRNLSSEEYPALSPRNPRTCMLELHNSDWQDVDVECEGVFEGQVSEVKATYTIKEIAVNEKETYRIEYIVNEEMIEKYKALLGFLDEEGNAIAETEYVVGESFEIPEGVKGFEFEITAWPKDTASFSEEDVDTALISLQIKFYNWNIRGMLLKDGKLAYMVGSKLYYDNLIYEFEQFIPDTDDYRTKQQLLSFGTYILIFPLGIYLNTAKLTDYGALAAEYIAGNYESAITYTMSDVNGAEIIASEEKPETPENGSYWLDKTNENPGMYRWSESMDMWVSVATTYIKISMEYETLPEEVFPDMFNAGDAVFMNSGMEGIDNGSIIVKKGTISDEAGNITGGYILVKGMLEGKIVKDVSADEPIFFKRKIPKLDFVCVSNNRVWGCYSGIIDGENVVNEIYASKLGDPKNWYCFEGASTDSYTLSLGDDGDFTGAFTYQGYPMFFKENVVYKIYGMYPAAYQLYTYNCRGVQKGSDRSIAVVNEYLMYKSVQDVCVFDGSTPAGVSKNLGNKKYYEAAAGSCMGKYYLSLIDSEGNPELFVFDLERGVWHKEDELRLEEFVYNNNGELYGRNKQSVYGFGNARNVFGQVQQYQEEMVEWMAETGDLGADILEKKYLKAIHIRAFMETKSAIDILVKTEEKTWEKIQTIRGEDRTKVYRIPMIGSRTNSFKIRLKGYGSCRLYSLTCELEQGSDKR